MLKVDPCAALGSPLGSCAAAALYVQLQGKMCGDSIFVVR